MSVFVAFDVETPNRYNDRMSAIGITLIRDGAISGEYYSLYYIDVIRAGEAFCVNGFFTLFCLHLHTLHAFFAFCHKQSSHWVAIICSSDRSPRTSVQRKEICYEKVILKQKRR